MHPIFNLIQNPEGKFSLKAIHNSVYFFIVAALLMPLNSLATQSSQPEKKDWPSLREVARVYVSNYPVIANAGKEYENVVFVKNPQGWSVESGEPLYDGIQLWAPEDGWYFHNDTTREINFLRISRLVSNQSLYEYSVYPYYGYKGWEEDVINEFGDANPDELTDNELYGLGKAYSIAASDIFWSHSRYSAAENVQGEEARRKDINRYLLFSEKAIASFGALYERSPDYSSYVGMMDVKFSNEILARFYELKLFGFEKEAQKVLKSRGFREIYQPFWKAYAREVLSEMEENAVVFTNGDNDTYPLLWMQEVMGYRRDVMVLNLSLLNDPKYILLLMNGIFDSPPLVTGIQPDLLTRLVRSILLVDTQDPGEGFHDFRDEKNQVLRELANDQEIISLRTGSFSTVYINSDGLVDTMSLYTGPEGSIISTSEFLVRCIMSFHAGKRTFYFTKGMQEQYRRMLGTKQINDLGLVCKLEKAEGEILRMDNHSYNIKALEELLSGNRIPLPEPDHFARKIIYDNLIEARLVLTLYSMRKSPEDSVYLSMRAFLEDFPPPRTGVNFYYPYMAGELYRSGVDKAFALDKISSFTDILKEKIESTKLMDDDPRDVENLKFYQSLVAYLRQFEFTLENPELSKKLILMQEEITSRLLEFPELIFSMWNMP